MTPQLALEWLAVLLFAVVICALIAVLILVFKGHR